MTIGLIVGNRGFFPGPPREERPRGHDRDPEEGGRRSRGARAGRLETRGGRDARRGADVRRPLPPASGCDRRRHRDAAEFRRRARRRGHAPHGRSERPGPGAGDAGHAVADDDRRPARQLLRQDVRLQQPEAVRHPLLAHDAGTPRRRHQPSSPRTWTGSLGVCRVVKGLAQPAHRRDRRAAGGIQHRPLQRETARGGGHLGGADRPVGDFGRIEPPEGRRRRRAGKAGRHPGLRADRRTCRRRPCSRWPSSAPSSTAGCAKPTWPSAPCSAGRRSRSTSASCRAP